MDLRNQLLNYSTPNLQVDLEGMVVYIKRLSVKQMKQMQDGDKTIADCLVLAVVDEQGKQIFDAADTEAILNMDSFTVDKLAKAFVAHNTPVSKDELKKS